MTSRGHIHYKQNCRLTTKDDAVHSTSRCLAGLTSLHICGYEMWLEFYKFQNSTRAMAARKWHSTERAWCMKI
jgi:hypothetical protein